MNMFDLPVRVQGKIVQTPESGCWLWIGAVNHKDYGCLHVNGRTMVAHRFIYTSLIGPIPNGLQLDHLCRVRSCVNPHHLEPVTCRENVMRGQGVAVIHSQKTHCFRGHLLSGDNLVLIRGQYRNCKVCLRRSQLESYRRIAERQRKPCPRCGTKILKDSSLCQSCNGRASQNLKRIPSA